MVGFGCEYKLHWAVIYVGFGFVDVGLTGVSNIVMTYVMDSYFVIAAESLLVINGLKNIIAFGFSYAAIPWVERQGYAKVSSSITIPRSHGQADSILVLRRIGRDIRSYYPPRYPIVVQRSEDPTLYSFQMGIDQLVMARVLLV